MGKTSLISRADAELLDNADNLYESRLLEMFGETVTIYFPRFDRVPKESTGDIVALARIKNEETLSQLMRRRRPTKGPNRKITAGTGMALSRFDAAVERARFSTIGGSFPNDRISENYEKVIQDFRLRINTSETNPLLNRSLFVDPEMDAQIIGVRTEDVQRAIQVLQMSGFVFLYVRVLCPVTGDCLGEKRGDAVLPQGYVNGCPHCGQDHTEEEVVVERTYVLNPNA